MNNPKLKHKRGIRIQTRIIISALLIILQLALLFAFVSNISYRPLYFISEIIGIITVIYVVGKKGDPSYKIAWIIFFLLFPVFGVSCYLLWGGGRVIPYFKKKMTVADNYFKSFLEDDSAVQDKLKYSDFMHSRQAEYLRNESGYPLYTDTSVEYLSPGEKFLPRFLEELNKAEKYIFLEFFIIADGKMWNSIKKVLVEKAKKGVEVKVMFDDFGSIKRQHKNFIKKLKNAGIEVSVFNKIGPSMNIFMNNRDHRKIAIIDGKTAVTGGLNLADEYINKYERFGYWMDCAVILKGYAVKSFLSMFCASWEFSTGKRIDILDHFGYCEESADGFVLPYADDPLNNTDQAEGIYMQIINTAQRYVYITTPYLIIDNKMLSTLKIAAKSGIDVRIILPHIPDKWYVHLVTQYYYEELLEAGVKIYEYTPGFIHSKIFVSDDTVATVGTVNMDYRSFLMHFECGVWMSMNSTVTDIKNHVDDILEECEEITLKKWRKNSLFKKLKMFIFHIFAPFM